MDNLDSLSPVTRNLRSGIWSKNLDELSKVSNDEYRTHLLPTSNSGDGIHSTSSSTPLYGTRVLSTPDILGYGNQEGQELGEGQEGMSNKQRETSKSLRSGIWSKNLVNFRRFPTMSTGLICYGHQTVEAVFTQPQAQHLYTE